MQKEGKGAVGAMKLTQAKLSPVTVARSI